MTRFAAAEMAAGYGLPIALKGEQFDEPGFVLNFFVQDSRSQIVGARVFPKSCRRFRSSCESRIARTRAGVARCFLPWADRATWQRGNPPDCETWADRWAARLPARKFAGRSTRNERGLPAGHLRRSPCNPHDPRGACAELCSSNRCWRTGAALAISICMSFSTSTPRARITSTPTRWLVSPAFTTRS